MPSDRASPGGLAHRARSYPQDPKLPDSRRQEVDQPTPGGQLVQTPSPNHAEPGNSSEWTYDKAEGLRAARLIDRERQVHGQGPTWAELAEALGWTDWPQLSPPQRVARMQMLRRKGWIVYRRRSRSLAPGARYQKVQREANRG